MRKTETLSTNYASEVVASVENFDPFGGTHLVVILLTFAGGREASLGHIFDTTRLNLCQSAVRAPVKHDIKLGKVLTVCLTPPRETTLMRAQRVALSLFSFGAKKNIRQLLCSLVHPSCGTGPHVKLSCIFSVTSTCILTCVSLNTRCDGPLVSWCRFCLLTLQHSSPQNK